MYINTRIYIRTKPVRCFIRSFQLTLKKNVPFELCCYNVLDILTYATINNERHNSRIYIADVHSRRLCRLSRVSERTVACYHKLMKCCDNKRNLLQSRYS